MSKNKTNPSVEGKLNGNKTDKQNKGKEKAKAIGSKPNSNKNKPNPKPKAETSDMPEVTSKAGNINDSTYYFEDGILRDQLLNFSFDQFLGIPMHFEPEVIDLKPYDDSPVYTEWQVPNVMAIRVSPSLPVTGVSNVRNSGINLADLKTFTILASSNSKGTANYDPSDVGLCELSLQEVVKMVSHATRPFGLIYTFNWRNREMPEALFRAMDIDYDDFKSHVAEYRVRLNTLIAMIDKIPIPQNIAAISKASEMFKYIYLDDDSPMAQAYLLVPATTWTLNETYHDLGSVLQTTPVTVTNEDPAYDHTFNRILTILENQISAILTSGAFQYIFADMLRLAEAGKFPVASLATIPDEYMVQPMVNDELRLWLHNAVAIGYPLAEKYIDDPENYNTLDNDVWQNSDEAALIYNPQFGYDLTNGVTGNKAPTVRWIPDGIIDFLTPNPDIEAKSAALRFATRAKPELVKLNNKGYQVVRQIALGDVYINEMIVYPGIQPNNSYVQQPVSINTHMIGTMAYIGSQLSAQEDVLGAFNYRPITYTHEATNYEITGANPLIRVRAARMYGEINYFTKVSYDFMRRLYDAEAIGLYVAR